MVRLLILDAIVHYYDVTLMTFFSVNHGQYVLVFKGP